MSTFNLKKQNREHIIAKINSFLSKSEKLSASEFNYIDIKDLKRIANNLTKFAIHGTGDSWFPVTQDPYHANNYMTPANDYEMGGNNRDQDFGLNLDGEERQKHLEGKGNLGDAILDNAKDKLSEFKYIVRLLKKDMEDPDKLAEKLGEGAKADPHGASLMVQTYEDALKWQKKFPMAIIETKGE